MSGAESLAELAEEEVVRQLTRSLEGGRPNYCCGGKISISTESTSRDDATFSNTQLTAPPVVIRWDATDQSRASRKIQFPLVPKGDSADRKIFSRDRSKARKLPPKNGDRAPQKILWDLLQDCSTPIHDSDGLGVADNVLAKAYRLSNTKFSINFNPQEYRLVDAAAQILLPEYGTVGIRTKEGPGRKGLSAELAELNVSPP